MRVYSQNINSSTSFACLTETYTDLHNENRYKEVLHFRTKSVLNGYSLPVLSPWSETPGTSPINRDVVFSIVTAPQAKDQAFSNEYSRAYSPGISKNDESGTIVDDRRWQNHCLLSLYSISSKALYSDFLGRTLITARMNRIVYETVLLWKPARQTAFTHYSSGA